MLSCPPEFIEQTRFEEPGLPLSLLRTKPRVFEVERMAACLASSSKKQKPMLSGRFPLFPTDCA